MFDDIKATWCDGIPGSDKEEKAKEVFSDSLGLLFKHKIIKSNNKLTKDELHYLWTFTSDILQARRRFKLRDRWHQPAVHFICENNAVLSQMGVAWLNHVSLNE